MWDDVGTTVTASPLVLHRDAGAGRITYTSFHNEFQATDDMEALLKEIILTL